MRFHNENQLSWCPGSCGIVNLRVRKETIENKMCDYKALRALPSSWEALGVSLCGKASGLEEGDERRSVF